ncbi:MULTISPECIES: class I SAM-dependent methyltransferase [unclassified Mycolicibacterium]|uniref:class I SAM-dependent methyltransferase n=1 Tax=unclassified Mycolicibacterium TaxID=2636767 RepID=UPI001F4BF84D|nr:class I SAM-dependent methyltransferase [Mycolicibacterium sp. YH-1]UNB54132.1 class I SAM-dependent methyltransferase [Mycolicibacterium sp. YH-1]
MNLVLKFSPVARRHRLRGRRKTLRVLGPELAAMTTWSAVDTELHGEAAEVVNRTPRVHELPHDLPTYESVVDRTRPIRMLEIGSFYGDSLQMWQEHLHPDSRIVGIDIDSKLVRIADSGGIHVRMCGEQGASFLREVAAEFGPFDVIIDAGSITTSRMADSFRCLFEKALSDGGVYLIEDVYCDYWTFANNFSFTDLATALIDAVYGHYRFATNIATFRDGHLIVVRRASLDRSDATTGPE